MEAELRSPAADGEVGTLKIDIRDEAKRLREARQSKDERALLQSAINILGVDDKNLLALNTLAIHYYEKKMFGLSKIILSRALKNHAEIPALFNNLGVIHLAEGKQRQAIKAFRKALQMKKAYSYASANLGAIYLELKDYNKAMEALKLGYESLKGDLGRGAQLNLEVANNYAVSLSGVGKYDDAKEIFKEILKVDENSVSALLNYAILLVERMKDKKEGEKVLNRLKFIVEDSSTRKRVEQLEQIISET
jgi:tetratricopeptide (TPR) repeat protein